jgi:hypothetical protein
MTKVNQKIFFCVKNNNSNMIKMIEKIGLSLGKMESWFNKKFGWFFTNGNKSERRNLTKFQ